MEPKLGHLSGRVTSSTRLLSPHTNENIVHESIKVEINHVMVMVMVVVRKLVEMACQQPLLCFPSLTSVDHLNELRSFHFLPHAAVLPRVVQLRSCETRMLSFQVSLQLRISPRELAIVHRTSPRPRVHEPPRASRLHRPVNLSPAVRTAQSLAATAAGAARVLLVSAVLLEAVGVTRARVAHVSAAAFGEGRALQQDSIVRRLHADHTPHVLPFTHALWLER